MDTKAELINQLAQTELFQQLTPGEMKRVMNLALESTFEEGSFLFLQDDPAERIFFIRKGRVKLHQLSEDGQQIIMQILTPGMLLAAISLVEGALYPLSAEAIESSKVFYWTQASLLALIEDIPRLALNAMKILASHVTEYQNRYRELATERVERRLARTILRLASQVGKKTAQGVEVDMPITRQELAEMCGTTLFTASRFLAEWERRGLVASKREQLIILKPHSLVQIAEDLPE